MIHCSIILPVKNGGEYIKVCVNSILTQTVGDFNLIILDSGSTDGTVEWIRTLKDQRIILYPSDKALTIEQNWGRIAEVPRREWMTIIGHDDVLHPRYLEIMTELIHKHPGAGLYACHFDFIDEAGNVIRRSRPMDETQTVSGLLKRMLLLDIDVVSSMVRSEDYDSIGGIPLYPNLLFADYVLWLELVRKGYKATASENGLSYRIHHGGTTMTSSDESYHTSYDMFINYLLTLKKQDKELNEVINKNVEKLLRSRCLEFSKRLLLTDKKGRSTFQSVSSLVRRHKDYADMLIDNNTFDPFTMPQIRLARIIDRTAIGRKLFHVVTHWF